MLGITTMNRTESPFLTLGTSITFSPCEVPYGYGYGYGVLPSMYAGAGTHSETLSTFSSNAPVNSLHLTVALDYCIIILTINMLKTFAPEQNSPSQN